MVYHIVVHYQFMPDEGKILEDKIFPFGEKSSASLVSSLYNLRITFESGRAICPDVHPRDNFYSKKPKQLFKEFGPRKIKVFLEGYRHCCEPCFIKGKDPHHEYVCADGTAQDFNTQKKNTLEGLTILRKNLGENVHIIGLCPPNHQGNEDTKEVARQIDGISYYIVRNGSDYGGNQIILPAWRENGLIIAPESKRVEASPLLGIMYSDIIKKGWEKYRPLFESSSPLSGIEIQDEKPAFADESEEKVYAYKILRDKARFS